MPIDPAILGFSNVWYPSSIAHATIIDGFAGPIRVIDSAHFCATKLEAFDSRSKGDLYHHDMEDVIAVVDGRPSLPDELRDAPPDLREFVADEVADLLTRDAFMEALPGHLQGDEASQGRLPLIIERLRRIAALRFSSTADSSSEPSTATATKPKTQIETGTRPSTGSAVAGQLPTPADSIRVRSTNITSIMYDPSTSTLTMEFHGARFYEYYNVPANVYDGLIRATSKGRYHHQWIKSRYRSKRRSR